MSQEGKTSETKQHHRPGRWLGDSGSDVDAVNIERQPLGTADVIASTGTGLRSQ